MVVQRRDVYADALSYIARPQALQPFFNDEGACRQGNRLTPVIALPTLLRHWLHEQDLDLDGSYTPPTLLFQSSD